MQEILKLKEFSLSDAEYIEQIKQKEIHENLAFHPINKNTSHFVYKVGSIPDLISSLRAEWLVKKLKKTMKSHRFVQVALPGFDSYTIRKHGVYYSSIEQRKIAYQQILEGHVDVLVLSLAELDEKLPEGLTVAAITERTEAGYTLVHSPNTIATDKDEVYVFSLALAQQIRNENADYWCIEKNYTYQDILSKIVQEEVKSAVLPLADVLMAKEIEDLNLISYPLPIKRVIPCAGQGALALVVRSENERLKKILHTTLHHAPTAYAFEWEKKASALFELEEERVGSFLELKSEQYYFHLYNPYYANPLQRMARGHLGNKKQGIDEKKFNSLVYQVYGEVALVGLGYGGVRQLSVEAMQVLKNTQVVYTLGTSLNHFTTLFMPRCKIIDMEQETKYQSTSLLLSHLKKQLLLGFKMAIALPGDPFFLNVGTNIARILTQARIPFKLIGGQTNLLSLSLELGIPFLSPGLSESCHIFDCRNKQYLKNDYSQYKGTLVFYAKTNQVGHILRKLEKDYVDSDKKCAYISRHHLGGEIINVSGRLGTFFRRLNELDRAWDGYFIVGEVVALSQFFDFKNMPKSPLAEQNILLPILKNPSLIEKKHTDKLETLGANVIQFKMGEPILTKKCRESLKQLLQQMTSGSLRLQFPMRIQMDELASKNKAKKASPLQEFRKGKTWLVFHSPTSVALFFKIFKEEGYDMRLLASYSFAVLDKWTFRALGEEGIQADLEAPEGTGEQLALELLKFTQKDDFILSFNYDAKSSIFDAILKNGERQVKLIGVYEQQLRMPPRHQLYKLFESSHYILLYDVQATMLLIQAMIQAGFDHATVISKGVQFVGGNKYVYELLAGAGFKVKTEEEVFGYKIYHDLFFEEA